MRRSCKWSLLLVVLGMFGIAQNCFALADVFRNHDIPLIDNRFRVDSRVDKISFILHRKNGSQAGILVRPDGSKIHPWDLPDGVQWLESHDQDLVTIEHPMPGPWQALVEHDGPNAVQILSSVELHVEPFPLHLFVGERLPLKAQLLDDGKPLKLGPYMDGVLLTVSVDSSNSSEDDNFAFAHTKLAALKDDGKEFDGYPVDGTYTGYLRFEIPAGKYYLNVKTANDVFTRGYQQLILVSHQPYQANLSAPDHERGIKAQMQLKINADEIKPESLVLDGTVENHLGWKQHFQLRTRDADPALKFDLPTPDAEGTYQVRATAYATTLSGRPLVMRMPNKSFVVLPPPPPVVEQPVVPVPEEPKSHTLLWVVIGVVVFLLLAGGAFGFIWWRKRKAFKEALAKSKELEEFANNSTLGDMPMQQVPESGEANATDEPDSTAEQPSLPEDGDVVPGMDEQPDLTKEKDE